LRQLNRDLIQRLRHMHLELVGGHLHARRTHCIAGPLFTAAA
jgi:hypothetical protein